MDYSNDTIHSLRVDLLRETKLAQKTNKRFYIILIILSAVVVISLTTFIYMITFTIPSNQKLIQQMQQNIITQQKIQLQDREDIKKAREDYIQAMRLRYMIDSLQISDSIFK